MDENKEIELLEKRGPREKHFLQKDGTIKAVVYSDNVHYLKDGKYEEIDNTLVKQADTYVNKDNSFKVRFSETGKNSLMKIETEDSFLNIKIKESNESKINLKNSFSTKSISDVSYQNILDGIDVEYKVLPSKVKETIILTNNKIKRLIFTVNTNLDLELVNGTIVAKNKNGKTFTVEKPYMMDSNGKICTDISYKLKKESDIYEMELILNSDWLDSEDTTYPVYIDPTITDNTTGEGLKNTYIYPGDTGVDKSNQDILKAGVERINGVDRINRTLIKFDLPKIGTGSEVIQASLQLIGYPTKIYPNIERTVEIHRVNADWDENANWEEMNDKYDQKIESLQFIKRSDLIGDMLMPTTSVYYNDITDLVKHWYRDIPNKGILLKSSVESYIDDNFPAFFSKNNHVTNLDVQPLLIISYRNQSGLENYLDYKSQTFSAGSTYVNTYNGNLVGLFCIGKTTGGRLPASLNLVYNTNDVILQQNGFKFNLLQTIKDNLNITDYECLEYNDDDGTIHYFFNDDTEKSLYYDEDGLELLIEKNDESCIMTDKYGNKRTFTKRNNGIYYLTKIEDTDSNSINIDLDENNQISKIVDANNSEITIQYNGDTTVINSPDSSVTLGYTGTKVVYIESFYGRTIIDYNDNNLISKITDVNGMKVKYEYYSEFPYKTKMVTQYGLSDCEGNYFSLEYGFNSTTILDNRGKINTLIFNSLGNLLSANSMTDGEDIDKAYSIDQSYGDENNYKNKILSDIVPIRYTKNYLKNTSFETDYNLFRCVTNQVKQIFSSEYAKSGYRSLKIVSEGENQEIIATINITKQNYYTFSGYFKNEQKMKISLEAYDINKKQDICTMEEFDESDEFIRHDVTIYNNDILNGLITIRITFYGQGIAYIDDIQLEEGQVANNYNVMENSDFSDGLDDWKLMATKDDYNLLDENGSPQIVDVPTNEVFEIVNINNHSALKVKMNPIGRSSFQREFPIKGKKGDIFNISFWIKNNGILGNNQYVGNNVMIYFKPIGHEAEYCILTSPEFVPNEKWQYISFRYDADEDYEAVRLLFNQGREANEMYITNLTFYKDLNMCNYSYDDNGNIILISDSKKRKSELKYDKKNQLIASFSPKGENFKFEYDNVQRNRVLSAISSSGISNKIKYDQFGNPVSTRVSKKGNGEISDGIYKIRCKGTDNYLKAEYDTALAESDSCSNTIWKIEKVEMEDIEVDEETGEEHSITQDYFKIVYSVVPSYSLMYSDNAVYLGTGNGNNLFSIEENKNGSYFVKVRVENPGEGLKTDEKYLKTNKNILGLAPLSYSDPSFEFYIESIENEFIETNALYTDDGKFVKSVIDSNFNETIYETDSVTGLVTSMTNAHKIKTIYKYNDKKQISSIQQGNREIKFDYNSQNLLSTVTYGSQKYNFIYDEFLQLKSVSIGEKNKLMMNEYESNNGNLISTVYGNNHCLSLSYDEIGRMKTLKRMDSQFDYQYDSNGNVAKVLIKDSISPIDTDPLKVKWYDSIIKYKYDDARRINEYVFDDLAINYIYDSNNNVTNKKYKLKNFISNLKNVIDNSGNVSESIMDSHKINYTYDSLDRVVNKKFDNTFNVDYMYVSKGKRTCDGIASIINNGNKLSYEYDCMYNITHIYNNNQLLNKYNYDDYEQLIKEEDYKRNVATEYTYDEDGNLLIKAVNNMSDGSLVSKDMYSFENTDWRDQLTKFNNDIITYDPVGNPVSIGDNIKLSWINGRSLETYNDKSKDLNVSYKYDINNIRISKIVNGTVYKYYLENSNIIYEKRGEEWIHYLYDAMGIEGLEYKGNVYYFINNLQGDVIGLLDSNFNQIVSYDYDSWGNILSVKDINGDIITDTNNIGLINPFRYRGYYYDSETQLYYLNQRYYNPRWCRFLNPDILLGANKDFSSYNLYCYASNNPIVLSDPTGEGFWNFLGKAWKDTTKFFGNAANSFQNFLCDLSSKAEKFVGSLFSLKTTVVFDSGSTGISDSGMSVEGGYTVKSEHVLGKQNSFITFTMEGEYGSSKPSSIGVEFNYYFYTTGLEVGFGSHVGDFKTKITTFDFNGNGNTTTGEFGKSGSNYFVSAVNDQINGNFVSETYGRFSVNQQIPMLASTVVVGVSALPALPLAGVGMGIQKTPSFVANAFSRLCPAL